MACSTTIPAMSGDRLRMCSRQLPWSLKERAYLCLLAWLCRKAGQEVAPSKVLQSLRIKARPLEPSDPTCQTSGSAPGGKANRAEVKNLSVFRVQQTACLLPSRSTAAPASHLPSWLGFTPPPHACRWWNILHSTVPEVTDRIRTLWLRIGPHQGTVELSETKDRCFALFRLSIIHSRWYCWSR